MSQNNGLIFYTSIATQVVFNTNPRTDIVTETTMLMNSPDYLSDKVKIDLENNNPRVDVATEESAQMNTLDHLSDEVKIDPNLPNNNHTFMDLSACMEETHPLFVLDE